MATISPLIRWAGSKRSQVGALKKLGKPHLYDRYVEPFCGSAALYFSLDRQSALLSDINHHLINFYKVARRRPETLYDAVIQIPRTSNSYYRARDEFNETTDPFVRACLFYYLNKNCFNGLFRTAKNGNFNVPFSKRRVGEYPSRDEFVASANALKAATFVCGDFEDVLLGHCRKGDFVYLDPPYSDAKRYPFREYYPNCFSNEDIPRFLRLLDKLDKRGTRFLVTFSDRSDVNFNRTGWCTRRIRTRRNIAGFAAARKYVNDVIVSNGEI